MMSGPILDYCVLDNQNRLERLRMDVCHDARLVTTDTRSGFLHPLRRKNQRIALYAFKYLVRIGLPLPKPCINEGISEWPDGTLRLFHGICRNKDLPSLSLDGYTTHIPVVAPDIDATSAPVVATMFSFANGLIVLQGLRTRMGISGMGWLFDVQVRKGLDHFQVAPYISIPSKWLDCLGDILCPAVYKDTLRTPEDRRKIIVEMLTNKLSVTQRNALAVGLLSSGNSAKAGEDHVR